jgi:hypothetical protein
MVMTLGNNCCVRARFGAALRFRLDAALLGLAIAVIPAAAHADEWVAVKLRGAVYTYQFGQWTALRRNDVVSDDRVIRTGPDGAVQFTRDAETVDMGANTQIRIFDHNGRRFTTINESFGDVSIEANVRNVKHFAVQTPFVAAVVKGTKFEVASGQAASQVNVTRGKVGVEDFQNQRFVDVLVNQHASAGANFALRVGGEGRLQPIRDKDGRIVFAAPESEFVGLAATPSPPASPLGSRSAAPTFTAAPPLSPAPAPAPSPSPNPPPASSPTPSPAPAPSPPPHTHKRDCDHDGGKHGV